jgi:hypothetical protein
MQSTACKARKWPATKAADDVPSHVLKWQITWYVVAWTDLLIVRLCDCTITSVSHYYNKDSWCKPGTILYTYIYIHTVLKRQVAKISY